MQETPEKSFEPRAACVTGGMRGAGMQDPWRRTLPAHFDLLAYCFALRVNPRRASGNLELCSKQCADLGLLALSPALGTLRNGCSRTSKLSIQISFSKARMPLGEPSGLPAAFSPWRGLAVWPRSLLVYTCGMRTLSRMPQVPRQ